MSVVKPAGRKVEAEGASLSVEEGGVIVVELVAEKGKRKNEINPSGLTVTVRDSSGT